MAEPQLHSAMFATDPATAGRLPQTHGWRFAVRCPDAEQVMLVAEDPSGLSSWVPMAADQTEAGLWTLELPESSVAGALRYYTIERGAVLNCGTAGLTATRIEHPHTPKAIAAAAS